MTRSRMLFAIVLATFLFTFLLPPDVSTPQTGTPAVTEANLVRTWGTMREKTYDFPNGDRYWAKRLEAGANDQPYTFSLFLPGRTGTFRYVRYVDDDPQKPVWNVINLEETAQLPNAPGFLETTDRHVWIGAPIVYKPLGRGTIEAKQEHVLPIAVHKQWGGFALEIRMPVQAGLVSEVWALESSHPLVPWDREQFASVWLALDLQRKAKWLYDGYYYQSPSTYVPTSPAAYWRIPENYVLRSLLFTGQSRVAEDMAYVMLDASVQNQEAEGYWKTLPRSEWLWQDYGIPDGYYDTRFNTGAAELMLKGCQQYREERFCQSVKKYAAFFRDYAARHHFVVDGVNVGWLVADYAHPGGNKKTHVSLNHQLAEINFLLNLYLQEGNPTDRELAEIMLNGVVNLGAKWVAPNGDLHYARFPDGSFGRTDYPYLTYNDLRETQRLYRAVYGRDEPVLDQLIRSKRAWMNANGVVNPFPE
ncbi:MULTISPECIES: hypothetical protein [Brevibacillus]|jgi:hypothetical protein|uniref:hypothetical protein n=1 Tax=Brevibacillus TaxID=55080 RepID=UPI000E364AF7|nr:MULTISPECIES: hypothetical protein [Bacillales]MBR8658640.1 hypothetical protein [Brevibacillus sp. NL20B1]MDT3415958.1 hypothetical protein [Brevibacillus aydinogluensis]REK65099.1 MAG: hypothetical protein DF221_05920 [Brevibacillus sp.]UFJ61511.1 hypothetical protein IRT44_01235 [Anoxybacillus sediminis]